MIEKFLSFLKLTVQLFFKLFIEVVNLHLKDDLRVFELSEGFILRVLTELDLEESLRGPILDVVVPEPVEFKHKQKADHAVDD